MKKSLILVAAIASMASALVFAQTYTNPLLSSNNLSDVSSAATARTNLGVSGAAPTISSGFGTSSSVVSNNGTMAFSINVGTGGTATSGVIGLPTAPHGWACFGTDITTNSTAVSQTKQTATSTTSATIGNFSDVAVATAWAASDIVSVSCFPY